MIVVNLHLPLWMGLGLLIVLLIHFTSVFQPKANLKETCRARSRSRSPDCDCDCVVM